MGKLARSPRLFTGISWGVTILIVFALLGFGYWRLSPPRTTSAAPVVIPTVEQTNTVLPVAITISSDDRPPAIVRGVWLKTDASSEANYSIIEYTVQRGDALFSIAKSFDLEPETLLWANADILNDSPENLRIGQVLRIPPVNGVYYQVQEGDTLASIADQLSASLEDILNWPGNNVDLTTQQVKAGDYVMVPGGHRELVVWNIPSVARASVSTSAGSACGSGPVGSGFIWPAGNHYISGNDFWGGHPGIDIAAGEGAPIYAAAAGVVTMAQGGWNGGYGNVVMIDHGNGYLTVYGHLSQYNVVPCQGVAAGTVIGLSGNTGNSFGAHLHFEIREGGVNISPWYVLPSP
jgi:murein DD-endopeptidase MepM/ murein hydrolase activator NlpD